MIKIHTLALGLSIILGLSGCASESKPPENWANNIDHKLQLALEENNIPGMAVALVEGNRIVLAKGYGVRDVENNLKVDKNTLFHIASTHKSLNSMLIATLVDNNVVAWDKPVAEYYSGFQLVENVSTHSVTLSHLLSMSSGIPAGAEDLLTDTATALDVFFAAKQSSLLGAPLEHFSYSNLSASIAGYVGVIASNGSDQGLFDEYANALQSNVLDPIGMSQSTIYASEAQKSGNLSKTYRLSSSDEHIYVASEDIDGDALAPSGSLKSNVKDMALYLSTQLGLGMAPNQNRVVSADNLLRTRQPIINQYALGWEQVSYSNTQVTMHTGSFDGFVSVLVLIPSYDVGLVLLANTEDDGGLTDNVHEILVDILKPSKG